MWLNNSLLITASNYNEQTQGAHAVKELEWNGTRFECRRELIASSENIRVLCMCSVEDGFTIFDSNSKELLHYSFV